MNPLRTRHNDVVFANWGGGGLRPPPTPPLSFYAVQACFQEHRTLNKTCIKHETVLEPVKTHHKGSLFAEGGCVIVSHNTML